jgi:hypothetical protein
MKLSPVSIRPDQHAKVKAYADLHGLTLSAAAIIVMERGLSGLPTELPSAAPATSTAPADAALYSANLSRF